MNQALQLPEEFYNMTGLGEPQSWHPVKKWQRTGNLAACLILLEGGVLVLIYGLITTFTAWQKHGTAMIDDMFILPGLGTLLLLFLGILAGWGAYVNWKKGLVVYEKGFAYRDHRGVQIWLWEEIVSLTASITRRYINRINTGTTHKYTLLNRKGGELILGDKIMRVDDLGKVIEQVIFPHLYAQAAEQYNRGQTIAFGPVVIRNTDIRIGKKAYPWSEVDQVTMHKGFLRITKKNGGWFSGASAPASAIPNLRVMLSIIDQVNGVKTE